LAVPAARLDGLPRIVPEGAGNTAFATKRYDRTGTHKRIHQEDFAQVLDVYPERKYDATNTESIANIVFQLSGLQDRSASRTSRSRGSSGWRGSWGSAR
jgi:serine/threonine-protein kinase HipA